MLRNLSQTRLKNGKSATIVAVDSPDPEWIEKISELLVHKGRFWLRQMRESYEGRADQLESTCYLALVDDEAVANIMISKHKKVGLIDHVFTQPEVRRQGLASALMQASLCDFEDRGGGVLWLSTGYQSPAYRIYESHGFKSIVPGSGGMVREREEGTVRAAHRAENAGARVVPLQWQHWPGVAGLLADPDGDYLRGALLDAYGACVAEKGFMNLQYERDESSHFSGMVVEHPDGFVLGFGICAPNPWWRNGGYCLDLYTHPHQMQHLKPLVDRVETPPRKVQAFMDNAAAERIGFCRTQGFDVEVELRNQLRVDDDLSYDLIILRKT